MKRLYPLLFISVLIYWSCEDEVVEDTTPPTVTITFPQNNSSVSEMVSITCISSDNEGVDKVELWVNGVTTEINDDSEPYSFDWNTTTLDDGNYTITIRSYDTSDNTTDSEPVVLTVDNTLLNLTPVELYPITWNDDFKMSWSQNTDDYFKSYKLYESLSEDMSNDTLSYETEDRRDTTFIKTVQTPRYYQIVIEDVWGLQSTSNIEVGDYEMELWGVDYPWHSTIELDLSNNNLKDSIPSEIGHLTNLTYLDLQDNQLTGSIPPEIGNLTNLTVLNLGLTNSDDLLDVNQLSGEIPSEIGNLTNLEYLNLSYNQLTGSIPPEIGDLTNLIDLRLYKNNLTGSIPPEIGNLTNLEQLSFTSNQLTGSIPSEIGNILSLNALALYHNQLTGEIPESICNLVENNGYISISNNQLCPPYPSCIEDYVGEQDTSGCD